MNKTKIISILLLFVPTLLYSQQEKLRFREMLRISKEMDTFDSKIADNMLDSLRQNIYDQIDLDFINDSLFLTSLIHERNIDSASVDTLDIEYRIVTKRGREMILHEEGNFPANLIHSKLREILEWQEIYNYMGIYERFPCDLIEHISSRSLTTQQAFDC
jgi:hypothetical protein